jgi:3-hydroxy-9,10-secoandrosta-1,3,5(10)-triene-9,17-dione monooxygenase
MLHSPEIGRVAIEQDLFERIAVIAPHLSSRAQQAEEARRIPIESIQELLEAGIARVLVPRRFGGYELGIETWFEIIRQISRADASHGWCASIIMHHAHLLGYFPEEAQQAVWSRSPDIAIAASIMPATQITSVEGGYYVSGQQSAFASGVGHSAWAIVGGFVDESNTHEWRLFLVPAGKFEVRDTWFTAGMRGTGSNTIVTDKVFVPNAHTLAVSDLRDGNGQAGLITNERLYCLPFGAYAALAFATPMLGAAQGAYENFRSWTKTRKGTGGARMAETASIQVRTARAAADLDSAELLLRRAAQLADTMVVGGHKLLARSVRDFARAGELIVGAMDALIALSGTAGYASSHPLQRVWRDVHFASAHICLNADANYAHFGRNEFDIIQAPGQPFF